MSPHCPALLYGPQPRIYTLHASNSHAQNTGSTTHTKRLNNQNSTYEYTQLNSKRGAQDKACNMSTGSTNSRLLSLAWWTGPLPAPEGHPFVLTSVTCRHQLPIRQCNIRPILPACDWEILEWSKLTNLIYRASRNKEIVPSLIALLNNECLFGNHFPISHYLPLNQARRAAQSFFLFTSHHY